MTGKIIKGISGFYYVYVAGSGIFTCKAKGVFRKDGVKPLVGDDVVLEEVEGEDHIGNVVEILPRKSELIRPAVANVDQALLIFALKSPDPNLMLLDKFLVMMEERNLPTIICFNKEDLVDKAYIDELRQIYENAGYTVVVTSAKNEGVDGVLKSCDDEVADEKNGIVALRKLLDSKTSTVAGPSGAGKSTIVNLLVGDEERVMETGDVSRKNQRGKQTTRHCELLPIGEETFIMDTPGFSSVFLPDIEAGQLELLFPEFIEPSQQCRFIGCAHYREPDCAVKAAVDDGLIFSSRYENYTYMYDELNSKRKY